MTNTKIVTTFGKSGKELYGNKFIESFLQHWPRDISLTIYYEDWVPDVIDPRIEYIDIDTAIPEVNQFRDHCQREIDKLTDKKSKRINWFNKAIRWSFKSLVMYTELKRKQTKYVIWLDGDVSTLKSPIVNFAQTVLQGKAFASQLEFIKGANHCESGIVIFDTDHADCPKIVEHISNGYINMQVLTLDKPWDGFWLALMIKNGIEFYDMNRDRIGAAKTFTNRYIFKVLEHNVGNRKLKDNNLHAITGRGVDDSW
jgi:hypothetical protein